VPSGYRVASNGLLVNETSNSLVTYHWKHRYPIAYYLIAIGITNYSVYREYVTLSNGVELEVLNYVYPEDADSLKNNTSQLLPVLQFFDEKYITYPFYKEKYGHAQFTWGGAMENQTMSFMGSFGFDILAHELSHQWFGNYITCATWQDIWLNEGFAKYSEALVHEHFSGNDYLNEWLIKYIDYVISEEDGSVWVEDTSDASRIFNYRLSYGKGALVLHMLRWEMGDSLFFTGINNYLNDPDLAFKTATTDDLKYHLENAADTSLTEFLDDWYYGQGFPKYKIYWYQDDEMKIYIKINQTISHTSVDFFEMHIPVQLIGLGKDSNIILYNTHNDQEYLIETNFYVKDLAFDPNHKILTQTPTIINELIEKEKIHIFPNPFSDKIYIQKHQNIEINEIRIFDISGKMLVKTGYNEFIFTGNLSSGVYFIDIKSGNKIYKRKIVKY
ncbi:MAG: T9SS type A sorting domain-containing protein, partial [Bacteroidales bacterium]|nr:T9SS type A sorting domain-containing protein [Bacteroidales bacterium]